jgi:hypothetical protein
MKTLLTAAALFALASAPAMAGEAGMGGCSWSSKATTAAAPKVEPREPVAAVEPVEAAEPTTTVAAADPVILPPVAPAQ